MEIQRMESDLQKRKELYQKQVEVLEQIEKINPTIREYLAAKKALSEQQEAISVAEGMIAVSKAIDDLRKENGGLVNE